MKTFQITGPTLQVELSDGSLVDPIVAQSTITAGQTVVTAPWRSFERRSKVRVTGVVLARMCNAEQNGQPCYEFQGKGWRPKATVGSLLVQSASDSADRWAVESFETFSGAGYSFAEFDEHGVPLYTKAGKRILAVAAPVGLVVQSLEGTVTADGPGFMLTCTKPEKGDWYMWRPEDLAAGTVVEVM